MKFLNFLRSLFSCKKKEQAPVAPAYTADLVVDESALEPIVEISDETAEEIADAAVPTTPKKKKYIKKKK
mgnify:CR=1 FL=1|jgi:hypothetical protein